MKKLIIIVGLCITTTASSCLGSSSPSAPNTELSQVETDSLLLDREQASDETQNVNIQQKEKSFWEKVKLFIKKREKNSLSPQH